MQRTGRLPAARCVQAGPQPQMPVAAAAASWKLPIRKSWVCLAAALWIFVARYLLSKGHDDCAKVTFAYFAVGTRTVAKARRSALSAARACPGSARMLVTDASTPLDFPEHCPAAFTIVVRSGNYTGGIEFDAFRAWSRCNRLVDRHRPWTETGNADNVAVANLRALKTRAVGIAIRSAATELLVFLDADTIVCKRPKLQLQSTVGFVAVPVERYHAVKQLKHTFGVTKDTPEANTGALIFRRRDPCAHRLADEWVRAYDLLRVASPPQLMDQVAFRAALSRAGCTIELLDSKFNCRGRDPATRAHAALACDGFDRPSVFAELDSGPEKTQAGQMGAARIEASLRGGRGCDIIHSHDVTDLTDQTRSASATVLLGDPIDVALRAFSDCCQDRRCINCNTTAGAIDFVQKRGDALLAQLVRLISPDVCAAVPPNRADLTKVVGSLRTLPVSLTTGDTQPYTLRTIFSSADLRCLRVATALDYRLLNFARNLLPAS